VLESSVDFVYLPNALSALGTLDEGFLTVRARRPVQRLQAPLAEVMAAWGRARLDTDVKTYAASQFSFQVADAL
jgi:hypothetical protein